MNLASCPPWLKNPNGQLFIELYVSLVERPLCHGLLTGRQTAQAGGRKTGRRGITDAKENKTSQTGRASGTTKEDRPSGKNEGCHVQ